MRGLLLTTVILLLGCNASLAQVSTMGTTAMGLSSTPGTIVTSPLNGPGPFSATIQSGAPDTTLAPVPLASDPTIPGTVVTCSTPIGQILPGTPAVPVTSLSSVVGAIGATSSISAALAAPTVPTISPVSATGSTVIAIPALSAQPATSFMSDLPGSTVPAPQPPAIPSLPSAPIMAPPVPTSSMVQSPVSTSMMIPGAPLGTIPTPSVITTTGNISTASPLGSPSTTVCSSIPGGPPTNGAALPISTPEIPANPSPGTIPQVITQLGGTSIDPTMTVMPTPNTSACAESTTMNLAIPGTMAPANATGAAATPGVTPPGC
jgi:hypothetical protein